MVTFRAGRAVLCAVLAGITAGCSQEQQDWRAAEGADSAEAWQLFLEQHPDSELVNQARERIEQLQTRRDFQHADAIGTVEAYRAFIAHHPSGTWSERARIRIESFALGSAPRIAPPTPEEAASFGDSGVRALHLATAAVAQAPAAAGENATVQLASLPLSAVPADTGDTGPQTVEQPESATGRAVPGEAAQATPDVMVTPAVAYATPAPPTPAPPTVTAAAGAVPAALPPVAGFGPPAGYGIQLGAFGSEATADREWRRLQERFGAELGNLSPRIVIAESDSRQLYRLQAPATGEAQARAICDSLREQSQACIPVVTR
ncbi:MAG: SPOR domain-containing protein [Steroidobacteraceae bacterium]